MDNNDRDIYQATNSESNSQIFITPDGREVGYAIFGAATGPTVFYLHGETPRRQDRGRRETWNWNKLTSAWAQSALDHAEDVRQLAEHLDAKTYGVVGVSGGGLYALACAYALPEERLKSVSIVAGMGPNDIGLSGMSWANWFTFQGLLYCPAIVRWFQNKTADVLRTIPAEKLVDLYSRSSGTLLYRWFGPSQQDAVYLENPEFHALMLEFQKEHFKQGVDGFMEDGMVFVGDPGFKMEGIRASLPMQLWCGERDVNTPLRMGKAMAARLQCRPALYVKDETHLSLVMKHRFDALERLLDHLQAECSL